MSMLTPRKALFTAAFSAALLLSGAAFGEEAAPAAEKPAAAAADTLDADEVSGDDLAAQKTESDTLARDLAPQLKPVYELGEGEGARIKVDAWVNRKKLSYKIGDTLAVYVKPQGDAYVTILNVGSSGKITVLYPNHYQRDAKVQGGTTVRIPSRKAKWEIGVGGPVGVDLIKVIASKNPLTLKDLQSVASTDEKNPVITLGGSAEETARDLAPQLKPGADEKEPAFGVRNILIRIRKD
jgi:hypothetical protein